MQTVCTSSEKELSNLSVTQLKSICSQVGIHPCKNQKVTVKALKAIEMEASLSGESSKLESSDSEDPGPQVAPADDLM
jgi:Tat protein secretion system quality control protein TatD with DNase activity